MSAPLPSPWSLSALAKAPDVDEPLNRHLHRPLAYRLFVSPAEGARWAPSPSLLTCASMAFGVATGLSLALSGGRPWGVAAGGVCLFTSVLLDNADGMLARATGRMSRAGAALDVVGDTVNALFIWGGVGAAFLPAMPVDAGAGVGIMAAVFLAVMAQAGVYYWVKARYERGEAPPEAMAAARWLGLSTHVGILYVALPLGLVDPRLPLTLVWGVSGLLLSAAAGGVFVLGWGHAPPRGGGRPPGR